MSLYLLKISPFEKYIQKESTRFDVLDVSADIVAKKYHNIMVAGQNFFFEKVNYYKILKIVSSTRDNRWVGMKIYIWNMYNIFYFWRCIVYFIFEVKPQSKYQLLTIVSNWMIYYFICKILSNEKWRRVTFHYVKSTVVILKPTLGFIINTLWLISLDDTQLYLSYKHSNIVYLFHPLTIIPEMWRRWYYLIIFW